MILRDSTRGFTDLLHLVSRRTLASTLIVAVALGATESVGLLLLPSLLDLVGVGGGSHSRSDAVLSKLFAATRVPPTLMTVLLLYVAVAFVQSGLERWRSSLMSGVEQDVSYMLRRRLYAALARAQWELFVRHRASDFTHVLTSEVVRVGNAAYYAVDLFVTLGIVVAYGGLALRLSPATTIVVSLAGLGLALVLHGRLERARSTGEQISGATRGLYSALADHLGGMKTTKSYGAEERHIEVLDRLAEDVRIVQQETTKEYGRFRQWLALGAAISLAVIVYGSVTFLGLPTATLLVLLFIFARLMPRLTSVYEKIQALIAELPALAVVNDLEERCLAAAPPESKLTTEIRLQRRMTLADVSVHYHGRENGPALRHVDLDVTAGSVTAIVGSSGAGKSTIADLLIGLIVPTAGAVRVDGQLLHAGALNSWRSQIGYVPQDPVLFHDTIRANLLWARPGASDADLKDALQLAAAEEFVSALPLGLETIVGDRGVQLSGGERQRIALARALIRMPTLLVLDEATSSLDAENERLVVQALKGLRGRTTIVIITHRMALVEDADMAYVLEDGRVIQSGAPRTLFRTTGQALLHLANHVA